MHLFVTKPSPYARKAWSAVFELQLHDRVEILELPARMPTMPKPELEAVNPLGKVPALATDQGELIADSPVIVAYLDSLAGRRLIPAGKSRWRALTLEALADGCMDAGVVIRVDFLRDEAKRDAEEAAAHAGKIARTLDFIESRPDWLRPELDIGGLALVCALDWLVFRELVPEPVAGRPRLAEWFAATRDRPSLVATRP
jgi:glutathione S-transferase